MRYLAIAIAIAACLAVFTALSMALAPTFVYTALASAGFISATPSPALTPAPSATLNVRDYGAKADGITDDAGAFRAAMQAAFSADGGVVYAPAGTYRLVSGVVLGGDLYANIPLVSGCTLKGAGSGSTILIADGTTSCNGIGAVNAHGIAVQDLAVQVVRSRHLNTMQDGLKVEGCTGVVVENLAFRNLYTGINFCGSQNITATGCQAYDCDVTGFRVGDFADSSKSWLGTRNVQMSVCTAVRTAQLGFAIVGEAAGPFVTNVTLSNCQAADNVWSGFLAYRAENARFVRCSSLRNGSDGFGVYGGSDATTIERCVAYRNALGDSSKAGIDLRPPPSAGPAPTNSTVTGCTSSGQRIGFMEDSGCSGNVAVGNDFTGNARPPIYAPSTLHPCNLPY